MDARRAAVRSATVHVHDPSSTRSSRLANGEVGEIVGRWMWPRESDRRAGTPRSGLTHGILKK